MSTPSTLAVLKGVRANVEASTGKPVGLLRIPTDVAGAKIAAPYSVVRWIPGGGLAGPPYGAAFADGVLVVQVDSVGRREDQALLFADKARTGLIGVDGDGQPLTPLVVAGLVVMRVTPDSEAMPEEEQGLVSLSRRYQVHVTPPDDAP